MVSLLAGGKKNLNNRCYKWGRGKGLKKYELKKSYKIHTDGMLLLGDMSAEKRIAFIGDKRKIPKEKGLSNW